ncbi:3-methylitaconate isomerase [Moraxella bovoculi]|uniref:3-methylitaconate isomerase n=1 Tax=Moraxella bovoculi TaxID=386891 RepID=A0AAC8PWU9_9GAMM|nr:2-methylaconitate cis-trans isomerase PrpF [Moraxella bovoculi]AKG08221.1 3-methylitaconate isomerase [Moraxella bovoculi]AKG09223.1 3-methylitaconate isomerase [Moraxella bovoculi]AKG11057.1 3-methylitaconate isomerase [Moraxella bovoculi]AKG13049.1 3-methylitaconate isomerase [Moraxella bovoculi]
MQSPIPATYMRGGTSKGTFFKLSDLPEPCQVAGQARDAFLLRVVGSPDPYGKQIDGLGNGSSSTSKVVILSPATDGVHDVNYLFGQVAIDKAMIDWSGNCGNLTGAVGSFAIFNDLIDKSKIPDNGICTVRIWQENIKKTIIAYVPIENGQVVETGDFELDGVTFPASEIKIEFIDPVDDTGEMFPTGNLKDTLTVPDVGEFTVTMINAGIPTIFLHASDLGFTGTEMQADINSNSEILARLEKIRAFGAVKMGLIDDVSEAESCQHTPKIAWVAPPSSYTASSGKTVKADDIDLLVRAMSMGQLHHAMMGTASVAIGTAGTIVGTIVNEVAGGKALTEVCCGHPSGTLTVGGQSECVGGKWVARKVSMSRSARRLMVGQVFVPEDSF